MLLLAAGAATAERPKIYKWVDSNGVAHYTTDPRRIPEALRDRIQSVERSRPEPTPQASAPEPTPPPQASAPEPTPTPQAPAPGEPETATAATEADSPAPQPATAAPRAEAAAPQAEAVATGAIAPSAAAVPTPAAARPTSTRRSSEAWFERDALPRAPDASVLASGKATPEQLAALAAEQEALDARIAEIQAEIARDESFLKGLISDPELDDDVPLFERPEFLEVSRRLPELQARLEELRDERAKLETP